MIKKQCTSWQICEIENLSMTLLSAQAHITEREVYKTKWLLDFIFALLHIYVQMNVEYTTENNNGCVHMG